MGSDKSGKSQRLIRVLPVEATWCYPTRYDSVDPLSPDWYRPITWFVMSREVHRDKAPMISTKVHNPLNLLERLLWFVHSVPLICTSIHTLLGDRNREVLTPIGDQMARLHKRLKAVELPQLMTIPGTYRDGDWLKLVTERPGVSSFIFQYSAPGSGRQREMGLGSARHVGLAEARQKADEMRRLLRDGTDPLEARNAEKLERRIKSAKTKTFKECAEDYIETHKVSWRGPRHETQWRRSLERYAYPNFRRCAGRPRRHAIDIAGHQTAVE